VFPHSGVTRGVVGGQIAVQDPRPAPRAGGNEGDLNVLATTLSLQPTMRLLAPHERPVTRSRGFRCSTHPTAARISKSRAVGREAMSGTRRGAC
jgi:hypothetical protein